jgi:hypothetical protein
MRVLVVEDEPYLAAAIRDGIPILMLTAAEGGVAGTGHDGDLHA